MENELIKNGMSLNEAKIKTRKKLYPLSIPNLKKNGKERNGGRKRMNVPLNKDFFPICTPLPRVDDRPY